MRAKELFERKQVGILYHFTSLQDAWGILHDKAIKINPDAGGITAGYGGFVVTQPREGISFTRNHNLKATVSAGGSGREWGEVRLAFDGDKISDRHKIEPAVDWKHGIVRQDNQAEEMVRQSKVDVSSAILKVDVMLNRYYENETDWDSWANEPDEEDKIKYTEMAKETAEMFFKFVKDLGIEINIVENFTRK